MLVGPGYLGRNPRAPVVRPPALASVFVRTPASARGRVHHVPQRQQRLGRANDAHAHSLARSPARPLAHTHTRALWGALCQCSAAASVCARPSARPPAGLMKRFELARPAPLPPADWHADKQITYTCAGLLTGSAQMHTVVLLAQATRRCSGRLGFGPSPSHGLGPLRGRASLRN